MEKIYFKGWEDCKTIREFLLNGFTHEGDSIMFFKRTYQDEALQIPQCHEARRSFEDLYAICATCIPGLSIEKFAADFKEFFDSTRKFQMLYCHDIMKPVHYMTQVTWLQNSDTYLDCLSMILDDSENDDNPDEFAIVEKQVTEILSHYKNL